MKANFKRVTTIVLYNGMMTRGPLLAVAVLFTCTVGLEAADDAAAQRLLSQARTKETQAQELRAAASAAVQKATDDQKQPELTPGSD